MWPNPQETADLVTFTGEILNGNFIFLQCYRQLLMFLVYIIQKFIIRLEVWLGTYILIAQDFGWEKVMEICRQ